MQEEVSPEAAAAISSLVSRLRARQNLPLGFLAGLAGALAGAALWAALTAETNFQIGYMAVGVGLLVGYCIRALGRGYDRSFAVMGAGLALFGCLLGNLATACVALAKYEHVSLATVAARLTPETAARLFVATFDVMDLLFYGIAIYAGYRYATLRITQEQIAAAMPPGTST